MTAMLVRPEELIEQWRDGIDLDDSPAGPLYVGGRWAESDLATEWRMTWPPTTRCSSCTASGGTTQCC
jgi:hypothetical protein